MSTPLLVVLSHVRWDGVYPRRHLLSRLAGRWHILYVEAPRHDAAGPTRLETVRLGPDLVVLVPYTPLAEPGFHDDQLALLKPLLARRLGQAGQRVDVVWLHTPQALPLLTVIDPVCVVYDCIDHTGGLGSIAGAPLEREAALRRRAALVLADGPSLYALQRERHPCVHCVPSAVEVGHFAPTGLRPGSEEDVTAQALQGVWPRPRLGFFGVVDARLDLALIAAVADSHPEWTLVLVGPVRGLEESVLPRRPNIHWLGMQPYERLPYLLAGWDLCMLPLRVDECGGCISPPQALEYMAGEKPVVSTPVPDVIALYGDAVAVAASGIPFVQACERLLDESAAARYRRALAMLHIVSVYSWQRSADSVHALLQARLADERTPAEPHRPVASRPSHPVANLPSAIV